ncbi:hypothetical protein MMC10_002148 [Thelotrema lepadinum]|nr:hypothetical protein [Thelotrema lepadinum]
MGIFSRRKDSKRTVEASETERRGSKTSVVEGPPVLRLNVSGSSLPEFESDTLRIAKSMPPPTQRPCLKRSSQSEALSIPTEDSDSEDFQDANSIASSISSRSSWTSGYSSSIRSTTPRPPTHVASGFERKMSKLPPVQIRDAQRRPKIALGHSKDGTPSWSLKTRPRSVAAH